MPPQESRPRSARRRARSGEGEGDRSRTSRDVERGCVRVGNRRRHSLACLEEGEEQKARRAMPTPARRRKGLARNGEPDVATLIELALEERRRVLDRPLQRLAGKAALVEHHADAPAALLL